MDTSFTSKLATTAGLVSDSFCALFPFRVSVIIIIESMVILLDVIKHTFVLASVFSLYGKNDGKLSPTPGWSHRCPHPNHE